MLTRLCIYCGANVGARPTYTDAARALGSELARRGIGLVYGGGQVGLMGIVADSVLDAGGDVIGVMPDHLVAKELEHKRLTDLRVVATMHERKALMSELADGFIAMPGGFGTYDEFCEAVTWAQLGLHNKPCALFNVAGFFDSLLAMFDHATAEGFILPAFRGMILVESDPARLLDRLADYQPPSTVRWLTRADL